MSIREMYSIQAIRGGGWSTLFNGVREKQLAFESAAAACCREGQANARVLDQDDRPVFVCALVEGAEEASPRALVDGLEGLALELAQTVRKQGELILRLRAALAEEVL